MTLLCYVKVFLQRNEKLPNSAGPLSSLLPSKAIEKANIAITHVCQEEAEKTNVNRGTDVKFGNA